MRQFKKLQKKFTYLQKDYIAKIKLSYAVANTAHEGQKRTSGESYITHPIAVAGILADMHMDAESIMAALLHDVIEDTHIDKTVVTQKFGKPVADLVDGVTKLTKIQFSSKAEAQAESFRKMILAMSQDIRVIIIKLADRLHNMRTLDALSNYKRSRIAKETLDIYAPIAHRLGMHDFYVELENLSFESLHPIRYRVLREVVKKTRGNRKEIMHVIEKAVKKCFAKSVLPKTEISGREKHLYSIYRKMREKHLVFSEIMDVYGFRIIVRNEDECYRALGISHSLYKPIPGKFKDYIAIPKINGYQSLHTALFGPHGVPIEIQIRTEQMDQIATKGIAAHWLYKSDEKLDESHVRAQQWISNMLEMQQKTGSSLEFIENVKIDLFSEQIYVFTPKGGIMELPRGSTVLDFAYAVHTDIGNSCVAAKIDRQYAPLSAVLNNGQTITVITAAGNRPNPAWLSFVSTGKARSAIRHFLKSQKQSESITLGKQMLTKALSSLNVTINDLPEYAVKTVLEEAKLENFDALLEDIGLGNRIATIVAHQLDNATTNPKASQKNEPSKPLLIRGAEGMAVHFANCCYPIPGDPIVGCISKGQGLMVHNDRCANVAKLRQESDKCILCRWSDDIKGDFQSTIGVQMTNKRGAFADITKTIADTDASIEDITIKDRTGDAYFTTITVLVHNRDHLNRILRQLNNLKIVTSAIRIHQCV